MSETWKALFRSRKFLILLLDSVISLLLYFSAKYAGPSGAEDIRVVIGVLQFRSQRSSSRSRSKIQR